jgi:lysophospholipase L1-like esterase
VEHYGVMVNDDETYPSQLSALLNASSPQRRFEVLNLGCVGYSSYQGKVLLSEYIRELSPDLVIVLFGGNDTRRTRLFSDKEQPHVGREPSSFRPSSAAASSTRR